MRQTTTALMIMAALALATPALAADKPGAPLKPAQAGHSSTMTETDKEKMAVESHLKAAGYDIMQARQMIQSKDSKMAQEMLTSARSHMQMAQDAAPDTVAGQIRRIEATIEQAERMARTDMGKAGQQVAQVNSDLQKLIKQESVHGGMMPHEHK
jgi:hypothetical protein